MKRNNQVVPGGIGSVSYNVYCVYSRRQHNILWSALAQETLADKVIGTLALISFIGLVLLVGGMA